ncbi:Spc24-domain-containing protein [Basidiobolus meristosporus CBS 931.73]|uniref:Kinetochore protein Spc24 n=1 Tax=Basidiobolus meristosporus CBS 931.73 TaxID=1314790 RepID=A0A1Y1XXT9_9FUNG|nr:Spc24-domain-containing protein [Basidiobolus meristosporus CBS 931.73]|eukprot:ORX90567.1 Spc24-domain-containing protein [Basidiobolus meristosporus CBS 931.73]
MEEPRALIKQTIDTFQPSGDLDVIRYVNKLLTQTEELRQKHANECKDINKTLENELELAKSSTTSYKSLANDLKGENVHNLEREKLFLSKQLQDSETKLGSLKTELEQLESELAELTSLPVEDELAPDQTILKLQIYRSLGVDVIPDELGNLNKIRVRSTEKNDIHTLSLDENSSKYSQVNHLWDLCS